MNFKTFFRLLSVILVIFCLYSCNKQVKNEDLPPLGNSIKNSIVKRQGQTYFDGSKIVFQDPETFEQEMNTIETEQDAEMFEHKFSYYTSYRSKYYQINQKQDTLIDEALSSVLNSDGVVQIGDWVFKLDMPNEKVYVIGNTDTDGNYQDLVSGNTQNSKILEFSTDDNVIDLLKEGVKTQSDNRVKFWGWFCRRAGCGSRQQMSKRMLITSNTELQVTSWYRKFGVWFTFSSIARYHRNNNMPPALFNERGFSQNVSFRWRVKCTNRRGEGRWTSNPTLYFQLVTGNGGSNALESIYQYRKYAYRGVSGLMLLDMDASYSYNGISATNGGVFPVTATAPRIFCDNQ